MSECQAKLVWHWLSEEEETERSEVTEKPVSWSFSFAEKVKDQVCGIFVCGGACARAERYSAAKGGKKGQYVSVGSINITVRSYKKNGAGSMFLSCS